MVATINADTTNGVIITSDTSGEIALQANGVTKAKVTANGLQDANGNSLRGGMYRNLIINGNMVIDQRNAGAEVIPANDAYTLDRWKYNSSQASKLKVQQNAQAITGPLGFKNYLGVTVNTPYTVTASDNFMISQAIEGYNSAHLEFGTANAKTITVSFWVQSSLTGTFSGSLQNSAENRSYPFEYAISSASTWEYKTITITGDTSGTWIGATNGKGLKIWFSLGMGSNFTGTANQWNGAQDFASSGETVKLVENSAAQWKITGVQLEVGSGASDFEHLPYDVQLQRCLRYYWRPEAANKVFGCGYVVSTTRADMYSNFPVPMRSSPSIVNTSVSIRINYAAVSTLATTITLLAAQTTGFSAYITGATGLTVGQGVTLANNGVLEFSAEL